MQSWEWGEVKALTGWTPIRVAAVRDGGVVGVMSLLSRKLPYLGRPILYAPRGPAADYGDRQVLDALLDAALDIGRERRALLVKVDPAATAGEGAVEDSLDDARFRLLARGQSFESLQPRFVWQLPLGGKTPDQLRGEFHSKTRYNIRLAERKGVTVRVAEDETDLRAFYDILRVTSERQAFLIRGYEYYRALWDHMVGGGLARLFLAEYEGRVISGTMAFRTGRHVWYVYGASSNKDRNVMPNYLLQWAMILWALEQGCRVYDFRGVSGDMDPGNPLYGLYRFKRGFGGHMVEYLGEYDRPLSVPLYHAWTRAEPVYRSLRGLVSRRRGEG